MEIERKYLLPHLPDNLMSYPKNKIEQAYLCTSPVVRIRQLNSDFILTYKSSGMLARQEAELPLTKEAYEHLKEKADGIILSKTRFILPLSDHLKIELDVFHGSLSGFCMAEVEFPSLAEANSFVPPEWFGEDVTMDPAFHNSNLSKLTQEGCRLFLNQLKEKGYFHQL